MAHLSIQKQVRENALELTDYLRELKLWEKEIKEIDSHLMKENSSSNDKALEFDSDGNPVKMPNNETEEEEKSENVPSKVNKERANKLKEEGNSCYAKGNLQDAIAKYTQGIGLNPTNNLLYANRAMAYLKLEKFKAAEKDCNRCLELDNTYIKGYLRRAAARLGCSNIDGALADYDKIIIMEPGNKDAHREVDNLKANPKYKQRFNILPKCLIEQHSIQEAKKIKVDEVKSKDVEATQLTVDVPVITVRTKDDIKKLDLLKNDKEKKIKIINEDIPTSSATTEKSTSKTYVLKSKKTELPNVPKDKIETIRRTLPPPRTSYQLAADWRMVAQINGLAVDYLKSAQSFLKSAEVEPDVLIEMCACLSSPEATREDAAAILLSLSRSNFFQINISFSGEAQKKVVRELLNKIEDAGEEYKALRTKLDFLVN